MIKPASPLPSILPIDKERARSNFSKAAKSYDEAAVLQREIGQRMLERLEVIRLQPKTILDAGCGTGELLEGLFQRYRKARLIALDFAKPMVEKAAKRGTWLRRPIPLVADIEALPLAEHSIDMVIANAALQWCPDLDRALREFKRVLNQGGLLMFSSFGPGTLTEVRQAWEQVDGFAHVSPMLDMHDVGDALLAAGFADPVMDSEIITLTYSRVEDVVADLRAIGAVNSHTNRVKGLVGKARWQAFKQAYESFRDADGKLSATYEVVYGHAWIGQLKSQIASESSSEVRVGLDQIKKSRKNDA